MKGKIISFDACDKTTYGVKYQSLNLGSAPVNGMLCRLEPGERSHIHNHFEVEFFLFMSGRGRVIIDNDETDVSPGMGVQVNAFSNHIIENTSQYEPLHFISFYWENQVKKPEALQSAESTETLVLSTPPTPNGDLHLGHLSGPYLAADIYKRYLNASNHTAVHASGRDDHQTYIVTKANSQNMPPKKIADIYASKILGTLSDCEIKLDYFIEPQANDAYGLFVKDVFKKLYEKGCIVEKDEPAAFSTASNKYLNEAFIRGKCPHCMRESDGNACEECGRPNNCVDLVDAYDRQANSPVTMRTAKRLYFKLSQFSSQLLDYIKSTPMSAHAYALSCNMINDGLPDICVTHLNEWGIKAPIDGFENQTIYVWFEMAAGYLWSAMNLAPNDVKDSFEKVRWFYDKNNTDVVHFYGFDNTYYHTLLFPAVYFALGLKPPKAHVVNELLDLEGSKFSTSRNHLIWGKELLSLAPIDYVRWFLSEIRPEGLRSNFTLNDFSHSINQLFFEMLNKWLSEVDRQVHGYFNDVIPEAGAWTTEQRHFYNSVLLIQQQVLSYYSINNFSPRNICKELRKLAELSLRFCMAQDKHYERLELRANLRTSMALSLFALKTFALLSKPIAVESANDLLSYLGISVETLMTDVEFIKPGTVCQREALPVFSKLDDINISQILANRANMAKEVA